MLCHFLVKIGANRMGRVESKVVFSMHLLDSSSKFKDIALHIKCVTY